IVSRSVGDECNEVSTMPHSRSRHFFVKIIADCLHDFEICALVPSADIIFFTWAALLQNEIQSVRMVIDIEPVSDIVAFAINGQWLFLERIKYYKRDKFLRKMIGPIVIRAIRY